MGPRSDNVARFDCESIERDCSDPEDEWSEEGDGMDEDSDDATGAAPGSSSAAGAHAHMPIRTALCVRKRVCTRSACSGLCVLVLARV